MAWVLRDTMGTNTQGHTDRPLIVALAVIPILPLSMIVTWFLYDRYPLPDDSAISLGLLGFVFVVLFDLFLLFYLIGGKLREGQFAAAAKVGLLLLGLGLLIAPLVGVLPWSLCWLYDSSPWVPFLLRALFAVLVIAMLVWVWRAPRESRRSKLENLAFWTCFVAINDNLVPGLLKVFLALLLLAGLIWKVLAARKQRRAGGSTASPA
jgi:hypothetical protein